MQGVTHELREGWEVPVVHKKSGPSPPPSFIICVFKFPAKVAASSIPCESAVAHTDGFKIKDALYYRTELHNYVKRTL